ncbi:MAG TPA: hypothetical protein VMI11_09415 [Actinomycetes bacterium]|nr:hypothetical protein [Actinomycetes bacterium]
MASVAPGVWQKFSSGTVSSFVNVGLLRTADGHLHAVWVTTNKFDDEDIRSTTFALSGGILHNGAAISHWFGLGDALSLVPDGTGLRVVFDGGQDGNNKNPFSIGTVYTATSTNGNSWTLVNGSLSSHTAFNQYDAATTEKDGTPVASQGLNNTLYFHVGVDPSIPAKTLDSTFTHGSAYDLENNALVRNSDGTIYEAWYEGSNTQPGYWIRQILTPQGTPKLGTPMLAPHSKDTNLPDNEPHGPIGLAARTGGGVYLAYCVPTKALACAHIDLWKVGSSTAKVVPGSSGHDVRHVSLSAGPKGRLVVAWFDNTKDVIDVVRTNTSATGFGVVRTVKNPIKQSDFANFDGLFSESSSGRIDLVAAVQQGSNGAPVNLYHTQVLEGLTIKASPTKVSHAKSTAVTFTVTDAGQAVSGATVTFLGHKAHTNSHGVAKITVAKGHAKGTVTATASKSLYYKGVCSVKIT